MDLLKEAAEKNGLSRAAYVRQLVYKEITNGTKEAIEPDTITTSNRPC